MLHEGQHLPGRLTGSAHIGWRHVTFLQDGGDTGGSSGSGISSTQVPSFFAVVRVKQMANMVIVAAVMLNWLCYSYTGWQVDRISVKRNKINRRKRRKYDTSTLFRGYILPIKSVIILT